VKPIVVIPAFDRTELFAECLNRLEKNDYDFDVLIAPDKSITRDAVEIDRIIRESKLKIKTLPRPPLRLGADKNTINSVNAAADMGYSHIICLGSDILVSENFIHDLMALSVKFDAFAAIPTTGRHSLETKMEHVNSLVHGANTGQNFCCPVHIWRNIRRTLVRTSVAQSTFGATSAPLSPRSPTASTRSSTTPTSIGVRGL